ncbi:MAG TPA: glycosyltransferase family 39 protein [Bacteroidales bacterium]|nr:glycosyltransferase family 39 protein [Bacteroidales bacterium]HPO64711.1 glycosyltransferase family 39 protein [Bacteroidales bacterium]
MNKNLRISLDKRLANRLLLLAIIVIGVCLRFYNFRDIPFTHDEFSALFRTNFNNFTDLIEKGVKVDGHPAGIQVFLFYWTKLFGTSEWVVKFPFLIFGVLSIYLIFLIAKVWYNETVALISAAYMATLQFPVMYSQIARPYISGLFFVLATFYFWTRLIKTPANHLYKNSIGYIIFCSLSAYNHHFSLLMVGILGIMGLFLIDKKYLGKYIIINFIVILLYLPHINIFFHQLSMGGVEGWLGKPKYDFIFDFLYYIFDFSNIVILLTLGIVLYGLKKARIKNLDYKNYLIFSILFFLPYLIGFVYSKYVSAVLQFSVLIFSFPFLFFLLFGHIKPQKAKFNFLIIVSIISVNVFALIVERKHYQLFYNSRFEHIITDSEGLRNDSNAILLLDTHKKISSYYFKKLKIDSAAFIWLDDFKSEKDFIKFLQNSVSHKTKLYFGCVSTVNPVTYTIIKDYFPSVEWQKNYHGGTTYLFTTNTNKDSSYCITLNFDGQVSKNWTNVNPEKVTHEVFFSPNYAYYVDSAVEWGPTYTQYLHEIPHQQNDFIDVTVKILPVNEVKEILVVSQLEANGNLIDW